MAKTSLSTYTIEAYSTSKDNNTPLNFKLDNLSLNWMFSKQIFKTKISSKIKKKVRVIKILYTTAILYL